MLHNTAQTIDKNLALGNNGFNFEELAADFENANKAFPELFSLNDNDLA